MSYRKAEGKEYITRYPSPECMSQCHLRFSGGVESAPMWCLHCRWGADFRQKHSSNLSSLNVFTFGLQIHFKFIEKIWCQLGPSSDMHLQQEENNINLEYRTIKYCLKIIQLCDLETDKVSVYLLCLSLCKLHYFFTKISY